jgi:hypothetical protein
MLSAVEFNYQPAFNRTKVSDERADRMLSTKLCIAELSVAQPRLEFAFRIGLLAAQPASSFLKFRKIERHSVVPST